MKTVNRDFSRVLDKLSEIGLIMMTDARLPSVASLIAGEPIRGSWWSHPKAQRIFDVLCQLADHKDVLFTKLVSGKVTLIHRTLWADLMAIAVANEAWQTRGLAKATRDLWQMVEEKGLVRSDAIPWRRRPQSLKIGDAIRDLEQRLLIHTDELHTESGAHGKVLETWQHWADRVSFKLVSRVPDESKQVFEGLLTRLKKHYGGSNCLPWVSRLDK